MNKLPITVLLAVRNEEWNIRKCLERLKPAERVLVVDSQSTDKTCDIALELGSEVVQFQYSGGHPKKRQWALNTQPINTPWVLLLDADEEVPDALWREIETAIQRDDAPDAFIITKGFHFLGRKFRFGGFSFGAVLLFRTGQARFEHLIDDDKNGLDMEIHERLLVDSGKIGRLKTPLIHDDYKDLEAYIHRHNKYSTWDAKMRLKFLQTGTWGADSVKAKLFGNTQERRRWLKHLILRLPCEPMLWFCYHYFFKLGFLEGRPGYIASKIRSQHFFNVRAKMYEMRIRKSSP